MQDCTELFAKNLRGRRRELGMTQRELAERLGYSEKSVSKWESGGAIVPSALLPSLAALLGVPIDSLFASHEAPSLFLGIDGGGTKTALVLMERGGRILGRLSVGSTNPVDVGIETTLAVLSEAVSEVCGKLARDRISVFAGIAGLTVGDFTERVTEHLGGLGFGRYAAGSDARNAVSAGLGSEDGVAVILGTGTVAFVQRDGVLRRVGGYGYLLEEGGSGYALGRDALTAALRAEDGIGQPTVLLDLLRGVKGGGSLFSLISSFYASGKRGIAELAPLVFEACDRGDAVAESILEKNAEASASLIRDALSLLGGEGRVVLTGGLTARCDLILPRLDRLLGEGRCVPCRRAPVLGALLLAGLPEQALFHHQTNGE